MRRKKRDVLNERYLHAAYLDSKLPGSFSGLQTFARARRVKDIKALEKALVKLPSFSKYRPPRTVYPRVPVIVKNILENIQLDLIDYSRIKRKNRGYAYILVGICVFSKLAYATAVKSKSVKHMVPALAELFKEFSRKGKIISASSDHGLEFHSKEAKALYKKLDIHFYSTYSNLKSQTIERFIRTFKIKLQKQLDYKGSQNWLDNYKSTLESYNNTRSRSHGFIPSKIKKTDHDQILANLYKKFIIQRPKKPKFKPGDLIRVSDRKFKIFKKKHHSHWSDEIFRIKCIYTYFPTVSYKLEDSSKEELQGTYVEAEITPAGILQDESGQPHNRRGL